MMPYYDKYLSIYISTRHLLTNILDESFALQETHALIPNLSLNLNRCFQYSNIIYMLLYTKMESVMLRTYNID